MMRIGLEKYLKSDENSELSECLVFKIPVQSHLFRKSLLIMGSSELSYYPHPLKSEGIL